MTANSYQYVVLRCVPRVEREEFVNIGVVLYCEDLRFLDVAWRCHPERVRALDPDVDVERIHDAMAFVDRVCAGDVRAGGAASGGLGSRFGFLKAPRSTVVQPGPVHGGITADPAAELRRLLDRLVG